jgi:hypothetical protein
MAQILVFDGVGGSAARFATNNDLMPEFRAFVTTPF